MITYQTCTGNVPQDTSGCWDRGLRTAMLMPQYCNFAVDYIYKCPNKETKKQSLIYPIKLFSCIFQSIIFSSYLSFSFTFYLNMQYGSKTVFKRLYSVVLLSNYTSFFIIFFYFFIL